MKVDKNLNDIDDCLYRVAVKAIAVRDDTVLLVQDDRDEGWTLPGGGVDHGENLQDAVRRELSEEIGIRENQITVEGEPCGVLIGHIKSGIPRCNIHFTVELASNNLIPTQEIEKLAWVRLDDLENHIYDITAGDKNALISLIRSAG